MGLLNDNQRGTIYRPEDYNSEGYFIDTAYDALKTIAIAALITAIAFGATYGIQTSKDIYYQRQGRAHIESLSNYTLASKYKSGYLLQKNYVFTVQSEEGNYETFDVSPQNFYSFEQGDTVPIVTANGTKIPLRGPNGKSNADWADSSNAIFGDEDFSIGWEISIKRKQ